MIALSVYLTVALFYTIGYGCYNVSSLREALFAGLFWPLDVLRALALGCRDWWTR